MEALASIVYVHLKKSSKQLLIQERCAVKESKQVIILLRFV